MKKFLFSAALFGCMALTTVSAQERATAAQIKDQKKYEKILDKELQKKAIKEARKEAKQLEKEGFRTPVGKLPLAKQLETAWEKQAEIDSEGNPYWYIASSRAIGANQSSASLQATNAAKIDLAGQIQTKVSQLIEAKVANDDMGQEEAASLSSVVASSKSVTCSLKVRGTDSYLKFFWFDSNGGELFYPNEYEGNALLKAEQNYPIPFKPTIEYKMSKEGNGESEQIYLMMVATKENIPFTEKVTFESVLKWIYSIPANKRCAFFDTLLIK